MKAFRLLVLSLLLMFFSVCYGAAERRLKIEVRKNGIYKVRYEDLRQYGLLSKPMASREIALLGLPAGQISPFNDSSVCRGISPLPIRMQDGGDGLFGEGDYFLFYGQSPDVLQYDAGNRISPFSIRNHPYSLSQYYFVCVDSTRHISVEKAEECGRMPQQTLTSFPDIIRYKKELANPLEGTESWLGERFSENEPEHRFSFDLSCMQPGTLPQLEFSLAAYGKKALSVYSDTLVFVVEEDDIFPEISLRYERRALIKKTWKFDIQPAPEIGIGLVCKNINPLVDAYLDYIQLSYERRLEVPRNGAVFFRSPDACGATTEFVLSKVETGLEIWQIDSIFGIKEILFARTGEKASFVIDSSGSLREFLAFYPASVHAPRFCGMVERTGLCTLSDRDYVIVTHPDFKAQADELAQWHQAENGYRTCVATTEEIYDEFSSGVQDPSAIRLFMKSLYDNSTGDGKPKYLLLFGDVSYDYKNLLGTNSNFIPTLAPPLTDGRFFERGFLGDDDFAFLEEGEGYWNETVKGDMDVAVGRLPVCTVEEARAMVRKIRNYASYGAWRNDIVFVGTKGFVGSMERPHVFSRAVDSLYPICNICKIYQDEADSLPQIEETRRRVAESFNKGCLFVGYYGHGAPDAWSNDHILTLEDIQDWDTTRANPILFASACSFAVIDNPFLQSGAEQAVLHPEGGCIASIGGTSTLITGFVEKIQTEFLLTLLADTGTIGDAYLQAKNNNKRSNGFVLLGDPGLRASVPSSEIRLSLVEEDMEGDKGITGKVYGKDGLPLQDFNGRLEYKIFAPKETRTLQEEYGGAVMYQTQDKVLATGEVQVRDGFFDFFLPFHRPDVKEQALIKISCYAWSEDKGDAVGYMEIWLENSWFAGNEDKGEEILKQPVVSVAPNPVHIDRTSVVAFSFDDLATRFDECLLEIFDVAGRKVAQENILLNGLQHSTWYLDWQKVKLGISSGMLLCRFAFRKHGSKTTVYGYGKLMVL